MLATHVAARDFPCVGAKAALAKGTLNVLAANRIDSAWDDLRIHDGLLALRRRLSRGAGAVPQLRGRVRGARTISTNRPSRRCCGIASSRCPTRTSGAASAMTPRVSADPDNPHFSLSFGGEAFFVVGLHPDASRPARRFARPTMVFNLHDQFETLARATASTRGCARRSWSATRRSPARATRCSPATARRARRASIAAAWSSPAGNAPSTMPASDVS